MVSEITCSIHLLTPVVTTGLWNLDKLEQLKRPGTQITRSTLRTGPSSIECEVDEALAVPDIIKQAIEAESNGASAIVIDCMADPGMRPAREAVAIPVLGPAETSMHLAAMLGQRFCVVTVLE
jgi:allantoin racemase